MKVQATQRRGSRRKNCTEKLGLKKCSLEKRANRSRVEKCEFIDFNGISFCVGLLHATRFRNHVDCTLVFFSVRISLEFFFLYQLFFSNIDNSFKQLDGF